MLSDRTWILKVSELEGALIPGLEIKAFDRDQKKDDKPLLLGSCDINEKKG